MNELIDFLEKHRLLIASFSGVFIGALTLYLTQRHRNKEQKLKDKQQRSKDIEKEAANQNLVSRVDDLIRENQRLKNKIDLKGQDNKNVEAEELIQEEKVMYIKFLYIIPDNLNHAYIKQHKRTGESIPVRTESLHFRFNKFNKVNDNVEITDSSKYGTVDLNIIHPWTPKLSTHPSRKNNPHLISAKLSGSDLFMTASSYVNGFTKGEEDYAIMAEYDTKIARLIADFSSIQNLDKLFEKEPNAYRYFDPKLKQETPLFGIQQISNGIYSIEARDLKPNEMIELDFHINWDYLNESTDTQQSI
jgi:hypothetical protein